MEDLSRKMTIILQHPASFSGVFAEINAYRETLYMAIILRNGDYNMPLYQEEFQNAHLGMNSQKKDRLHHTFGHYKNLYRTSTKRYRT